jgi:hypothetical protein
VADAESKDGEQNKAVKRERRRKKMLVTKKRKKKAALFCLIFVGEIGRAKFNLHSLESNKEHLISDHMAGIALVQLGNSEGATSEDEQCGKGQEAKEKLHSESECGRDARSEVPNHVV